MSMRDHKRRRDHILEVRAAADEIVHFIWDHFEIGDMGEDDDNIFQHVHDRALSVYEFVDSLVDEQLEGDL